MSKETPKGKAKELYDHFFQICEGYDVMDDGYDAELHHKNTVSAVLFTADQAISTLKQLDWKNDMKVRFHVKHWEWTKEEAEKIKQKR